MRAHPVKTLALVISLVALAAWAETDGAAGRQLVLVCSAESTFPAPSREEVRRIFLGVPVFHDGDRIRPLRNESDPEVIEVFLQKVIFMSRRSYERQLVSRVFRTGGTRPPSFGDTATLLAELRRTPEAVSYAWLEDVQGDESLKVLRSLWVEPRG